MGCDFFFEKNKRYEKIEFHGKNTRTGYPAKRLADPLTENLFTSLHYLVIFFV